MHLDTAFLTNATGEKLPLWDAGQTPLFNPEFGQLEPSLYPYLLKDKPTSGAVIVCPGGAYSHKAPHEAEPIALKFNELGFHAFVLDYRVAPYKHPAPLLDAQRAIRYVRHNAQALGVNPHKIAILGFSAGGHLAASALTHYDLGDSTAACPIDRCSCRPDACVLCYGVISLMYHTHAGSMINLLGENPPIEMRRALSAELNVSFDTPPTFMWHTAADMGVPVQNSIELSRALCAHGVPNALHIYPYGRHGLGLAEGENRETFQAKHWPQDAARFLTELGF